MSRLWIGNTAPHECRFDEGGRHVGHDLLDHGPCVTYVVIPDADEEGNGGRSFNASPPTPDELRNEVARAIVDGDGVTHLPGHEALLDVLGADGLWRHHSSTAPAWVSSDDEQFGRYLAGYWGCEYGEPADVEDTHFTVSGPPGVGPLGDLQANITQNGRDIVARALGQALGVSGISTTGPTGTTYTLDGKGAPGSTSAWNGQTIIAGSTSVAPVQGKIVSNTNVSSPVVTVDHWEAVGTPGITAATTPLAGPYVIIRGNDPAVFMAISANSSALGTPSTNTSLPGEITTSGGGLIRAVTTFAHTASAGTYTETVTFTANGSDSLPVTIASTGNFTSSLVADTASTMLYNDLLGTTATLSLSGDNLTLTQTVTLT